MMASQCGKKEIVEMLLNAGASPNLIHTKVSCIRGAVHF